MTVVSQARREQIIQFALRKFINRAYMHASNAADAYDGKWYRPGDYEKFRQDAKDAEIVLETLGTGFQTALDIASAQGWELTGRAVPVLYTDTINGIQVMRDDVWLCLTPALATKEEVEARQ